jgi:hypothetical protein
MKLLKSSHRKLKALLEVGEHQFGDGTTVSHVGTQKLPVGLDEIGTRERIEVPDEIVLAHLHRR